MRHHLFSISVFFQVLALVILSQCQVEGQCNEKNRAITTRQHFDKIKQHMDSVREQLAMLKGALEDLGCQQRKTSNLNEKTEINPSQQRKSAPRSPDVASAATISSPKRRSDDICPLTLIEGVKKNITCFLSEVDIEKGLNLENLITLKLCTDIIMVVKHTYTDVQSGKSTFQYLNQSRESANVEKWRSLNLRIFMQIGSWDDEKRLTGTQFSRFFEMPKARERFVSALATRLQQNNFDGLLISWYFPGCVRETCTSGDIKDNQNSAIFFKQLAELLREKAIKVKIAVEVSVRLVNNIFIYRLNDLVKYVDLMLFEHSSPENRIDRKPRKEYRISHAYDHFGNLDKTSNYTIRAMALNPKVVPGNAFMELETTTAYFAYTDDSSGAKRCLKNITAKNLCKIVLSAPEVIRNTEFKWPINIIEKSTDTFPINDFDYMKARVDEYVNKLRLGGVWIRDLWADDMENECNCGAFPILRAANEAIGRSTNCLPNCPTASVKKK